MAKVYRLVNEQGEIVKTGAKVKSFRDEEAVLLGFTPPRHEGSSGRVLVRKGNIEQEFYPSVFHLKIEEIK